MILPDKILSELIGVVGWRQSTIAGDVVISATNLSSSSGLFVQGAHPQATVKNIKATQEDRLISDANMNILLSNLVKDGTTNVLAQVFPENDILSNNLLYKYESSYLDVITGFTGFVGYEITIAQRTDLVLIINKIILQFNGAGTVKLLLFNSGLKLPLATKTITVSADTNITAVCDWVLGNITAPGGKYYIGYLTADLAIGSYNRVYNLANLTTCFNSISFAPIYVESWNKESLFDITKIVYRSETFGLNFDVSTVKDYSNVILQNKSRFAKAIQLSAAVQAIALMTTTGRINPEERMIMQNLNQKVIIDSPATYNLYSALEKEIKGLISLFRDKQITITTIR